MTGYEGFLVEGYAYPLKHATPTLEDLFNEDESPKLVEMKRLHTYVAKLLYLAKQTRPECLVATSFLCTRESKQLNPSTTAECVVSLVNREVGVIANPSQQTQLLFISFTKHIRLPECAKAHKGWLPTYQPLPNTT